MVRFAAASDDALCVRFEHRGLSCVLVETCDGLHLEPVNMDLPPADSVALGFTNCFAVGAQVTCYDFAGDDARDEAQKITFPSPPRDLFILPGRADAHGLLGPSEVCGRGTDHVVRCMTMSDDPQMRVLFRRSVAVRSDDADIYSLRDDGTLQCIGDASCAAIDLAMERVTLGWGTGGAGSLTGRSPPAPPPQEKPHELKPEALLQQMLARLPAVWPNGLEGLGDVSSPTGTVPLHVTRLLSAAPCVTVLGGRVLCWERLAAPHLVGRLRPSESLVPWGLLNCVRSGDRVSCTPDPTDGAPSPQGFTFTTPGLERLVRVGPALCTVDRAGVLACRYRRSSGKIQLERCHLP